MPDADETLRQYVEQKSANELVGGNRHCLLFVAVSVIPPTECDVAAIEGEQSVIGDGDAVSVAPEVTQHLFRTAEWRLGIDDPVLTE